MFTEFKYALRRSRGAVIGWSIGLALYSLILGFLFDPISKVEGLEALLQAYPPELMAFFGDVSRSFTPIGYLDTWFFSYITLITGVFAIMSGANLLAGDEEKGILDLVLAYPISRSALFWARLLAFAAGTIIILLVVWLSWAVPSGSTQMNLSWMEFLRPFLPLFAVLFLFGTLALLLSMLLPAARLAAIVSGALLVVNFMLIGLAHLDETFEAVAKLTPLYYFQGGDAASGLDWGSLGGLLFVSLLFVLAAWALFQRRDIRVAGEHGWRFPALRE